MSKFLVSFLFFLISNGILAQTVSDDSTIVKRKTTIHVKKLMNHTFLSNHKLISDLTDLVLVKDSGRYIYDYDFLYKYRINSDSVILFKKIPFKQKGYKDGIRSCLANYQDTGVAIVTYFSEYTLDSNRKAAISIFSEDLAHKEDRTVSLFYIPNERQAISRMKWVSSIKDTIYIDQFGRSTLKVVRDTVLKTDYMQYFKKDICNSSSYIINHSYNKSFDYLGRRELDTDILLNDSVLKKFSTYRNISYIYNDMIFHGPSIYTINHQKVYSMAFLGKHYYTVFLGGVAYVDENLNIVILYFKKLSE